jgi:hypothetical protein
MGGIELVIGRIADFGASAAVLAGFAGFATSNLSRMQTAPVWPFERPAVATASESTTSAAALGALLQRRSSAGWSAGPGLIGGQKIYSARHFHVAFARQLPY